MRESNEPTPVVPASVQPKAEPRVLPQFSFRTVGIAMTVLVLAAFIYRRSMLGSVWAEAVVFATATILVCFACFAALFLLAWIPALIGRDRWEDVVKGNPFAEGQLPPQLLPPAERQP